MLSFPIIIQYNSSSFKMKMSTTSTFNNHRHIESQTMLVIITFGVLNCYVFSSKSVVKLSDIS